jgi:hypothetical protein
MSRLAVFLALAVAFLVPALPAQSTQDRIVTTVPACLPTATLDQLVKALDDAVSGPADKDRTCFRQALLPNARLTPIRIAADGTATPRILTVDGWIDAVRKRGSQVFYEKQIKVETETYGHMAHLWSTYETRTDPAGKAVDRGINSIQAIFDGHRWRIAAILWQAETPAEKVPEKYLP